MIINDFLANFGRSFLFALATLLPILNPPAVAPIFLTLTEGASAQSRSALAQRVSAMAQEPAGVDVRRFGAIGDGMHDDSAAFAAALARSPSIHVPAGTYLVDRVMIPSGRTVSTDGFATRFRQRPDLPEGTRLLNVVGSNVRIGDCTVEGNIASNRGEQYHGIFVNATEQTGDLTDIVIGNVRGANLRGDVVYGYEATGNVSDGPTWREQINEVVPYSHSLPSPDGAYWRCKRPDGTYRCFFAPKPEM